MGLALEQQNESSGISKPQATGDLTKGLDIETQAAAPRAGRRAEELKAKLKSLLAKYDGSTKHPDVVEVIDELAAVAPIKEKCSQSPLFLGEFVALTSPNFPGRIKPQQGEEGVVQYTLGRLSFNIFQPTKLVCTLRSVRNPVSPRETLTADGKKTFGYPLYLDITIHTPDGDLPAILMNEAWCYESPDKDNRLMVSFGGGTLMPADEIKRDTSKLKIWAKTFEGAYKKADDERSYVGRIFQFILKLVLGLTMPTDDSLLKHSFHFDMKRSPVGYLEVLYLDNDIRITRGNRGTIVVVERVSANTEDQ